MVSLTQELIGFDDHSISSSTQSKIIKLLKEKGPMPRREIVTQLNIARTTIYDNLNRLLKRNIVEKFTKNNGERGRPLTYWKVIE